MNKKFLISKKNHIRIKSDIDKDSKEIIDKINIIKKWQQHLIKI